MGQVVTKFHISQVSDVLIGRKRRRSVDSNSSPPDKKNSGPTTPKKKKLLTTTQYIYKALFKEQKNSDVCVTVLDKTWHLHKVYLSQSPYFYTMFNGSWKESKEDHVFIKIDDERITLEALDAVFGSMYSDEIEIEPKAVISILATATHFHLDGIIDKCAEVMIDNINAETAVQYYEAACQYGSLSVKNATFKWFQINLLSIYSKQHSLLRTISIELMTALTASPDLYVMQTEFSLYTLLRAWVFLRLHPEYDPEGMEEKIQAQEQQQRLTEAGVETHTPPVDIVQWTYFANRTEERSFLATPEGQPYVKTFQKLRTQYLTNHHMDLKIILNDNIIPKEWIHRHVLSHWNSILKVDHLPREGPQRLPPDEFYNNCMRCGRLLLEPGYQKWRWTGFNFGLDLILVMDSRVLNIRRHQRHEHERLLSLQTKRQFMIRTTVTSINSQRQPVFTQSSEITSLNLEKNEEVSLMLLDTKLVHPLLISVNLLVVHPTSQAFKEIIPASEEFSNAAIPISEIGANFERSLTPTNNDGCTVSVTPPTPTTSSERPTCPFSQHSLPQRRAPWSISSTATSSSSSSHDSSLENAERPLPVSSTIYQ